MTESTGQSSHRVETVEDLAELVREDPVLAREIQSRPAEAIAELAGPDDRDRKLRAEVVEASQALGQAASETRERQYQTYAGLGVLAFVAGASVGAGALIDEPIFWGAAGSVFFMASAGLIAWAAKGLGISAQLIELVRGKLEQARDASQQ